MCGVYGTSPVPSSQFCCKPKSALKEKKKKTLLKKKKMGGDSKQPYKDVNWQNKGSSTQGH